MQQRGASVMGLARDLFAPLQRPSSPFQSRSSPAPPSTPVVACTKAPPKPPTERERGGEECKKAEEEERQAAYLNGRRLLLPGSGSAGVAKLPQRGIELLWRAYELGHEAALWDLACCVAAPAPAPASEVMGAPPSSSPSGEEVAYAIDWTLAVPLYKMHAKAGHPIAQKNLGTCYFRGWGVSHNIGKATELYQKASLQNYDVAQYNLGVCYRQGDGVETDPSRMLGLYQKAADQGLHAAQCALAKCYLYSRGVPMDWAKATALMTQAADGYPAAMVILARWYEVGYFKLMPDTRKAMEYAIRAVYEKEVDAWDIVFRLLSRYYAEDKRGPFRAPPPSLLSICCDWVYAKEIVGQCLVRSQLMARDTAARRGLSPGMVEREGHLVLQCELRRRERLMRVLPTDTQDKLRTNRSVCFSPSCSREFYGGGRVVRRFVMRKPDGAASAATTTGAEEDDSIWDGCGRDTLVGLPSSTPVLSRDEVVLHFCSMACATSSLEREAEQTLA